MLTTSASGTQGANCSAGDGRRCPSCQFTEIAAELQVLGCAEDVIRTLRVAMREYGEFGALVHAPDLQHSGIGPAAVRWVKALRRVIDAAANRASCCAIPWEELRRIFARRLAPLQSEVFEVACLGPSRQLLPDGVVRLSVGTPSRCTVYPREVLRAALRRNASAVLLAHNHPEGSATPSSTDRALTRSVELAGVALDLEVIDHLIIGAGECFSFRDAGLIGSGTG